MLNPPLLLLAAVMLFCGFPALLQEAQKPAEVQKPAETQKPVEAQNPAAPAPSAAQSKIPPEAANQVNPVHPTPQSLARAKDIYGFDCALCHGAKGDGKGDLVVDSKVQMLDYRDPAALKGLTDGEIFYIIKNGRGQMPPEGDRAKPDEIWNLVIYLRSLSKQPGSAASRSPS